MQLAAAVVPSMQSAASSIVSLIAVPSAMEATAMPAPTSARIRAYSAAEAPESSRRKDFTKVIVITPFQEARLEVHSPVQSNFFSVPASISGFAGPEGGVCMRNRRDPICLIETGPTRRFITQVPLGTGINAPQLTSAGQFNLPSGVLSREFRWLDWNYRNRND